MAKTTWIKYYLFIIPPDLTVLEKRITFSSSLVFYIVSCVFIFYFKLYIEAADLVESLSKPEREEFLPR